MTFLKKAFWSSYQPKRVLPVILVFTAGLSASGQSVIITPDIEPTLAAYLRRQNVTPPPLSRPSAAPLTPYQIGGIVFHTQLNYRHMKAEGLPVAGNLRVSSDIRTVSAEISADLGEHWTLDYNPTWTSYTGRALSNSFDQSVSLSGAGQIRDWSFEVSETFTKSKPTLVETARQTEQQSWRTTLGATYRHSEKLQVQNTMGLSQRTFEDPVLRDIRRWSGSSAVNYRISGKLGFVLGPDFHYTEVADAPDTYGGGVDATFNWQPVPKLRAMLGGGLDYIKSKASTGNGISSPRINATVTYQPFETTTIVLATNRSTSTSSFRNQAVERVGWSAGLNQRLLQRFFLAANYTRSENDYTALTQLPLPDRTDETRAYNLRLSTRLFQRLSAAVVWRKSENTSNSANFTFSSKQYGIELGYSY